MSSEVLSTSLVKAADAAGYAMAAREEVDWALLKPEDALRNGHASAARRAPRLTLPFAGLADLIHRLFALSDLGRAPSRLMLTSR